MFGILSTAKPFRENGFDDSAMLFVSQYIYCFICIRGFRNLKHSLHMQTRYYKTEIFSWNATKIV